MVIKSAPVKLSTVLKNITFLLRNLPVAAAKAEAHFTRAIEMAQKLGAHGTAAQSFLDLGRLYAAKGRREKAEKCFASAIELFEKCGAETFLAKARIAASRDRTR